MATAAPGNATRRYDGVEVHWRPPVNGRGPWLALDDYSDRKPQRPFGDDPEAWLPRLPHDAGPLLEGLSPDYFRPTQLPLEPLGRMHGPGWQSSWAVSEPALPPVQRVQPNAGPPRPVLPASRGSLLRFTVVQAAQNGSASWRVRVFSKV